MNSKAKGNRGELEVAHLFQAYGYDAKRGQQFCGLDGNADVVGVPYIWIEVKRNEHLNILSAMTQAERDSNARRANYGDDLLPVVIHRKNNAPWVCTMRVGDFLTMCGAMPFTSDGPVDGLVSMAFQEWIELYMVYEKEEGSHD